MLKIVASLCQPRKAKVDEVSCACQFICLSDVVLLCVTYCLLILAINYSNLIYCLLLLAINYGNLIYCLLLLAINYGNLIYCLLLLAT
jgi:hypothetical protein